MGKKSPCLSCKHKNVYEPLTKCFVCNFSGIECKNFEMYKPNALTNADRIRAMSDEELAEWLCDVAGWLPAFEGRVHPILEWLRQEAVE